MTDVEVSELILKIPPWKRRNIYKAPIFLGSSSFLQSLLKISIICFFSVRNLVDTLWFHNMWSKKTNTAVGFTRVSPPMIGPTSGGIMGFPAAALMCSFKVNCLERVDIFRYLGGPTRRCYILLTYHLHKQNTASSFFGTNVGEIKM